MTVDRPVHDRRVSQFASRSSFHSRRQVVLYPCAAIPYLRDVTLPARRTLDELLERDAPAWPLVRDWIAAASNSVEVLKPSPERALALLALQLTTRSTLGAIVYETGGLLLDHGWLRVLGSGEERLRRSVPEWNRGRSWHEQKGPPAFLLIADDVLGGFFAIDGGGLGAPPGTIQYRGPDSLGWHPMHHDYTEFLLWCLCGDLEDFYGGHRWSNWRLEVSEVGGDEGLLLGPCLDGGEAFGHCRTRQPVPIESLYELLVG